MSDTGSNIPVLAVETVLKMNKSQHMNTNNIHEVSARMLEIEQINMAYNKATDFGTKPNGQEDEIERLLAEWDTLKAQRTKLKEPEGETSILYYAVYMENTLGFIFSGHTGRHYLGILHASVLKDSSFNWLSGPILVNIDDVRKATPKDFEEYRVALPYDFATLNA